MQRVVFMKVSGVTSRFPILLYGSTLTVLLGQGMLLAYLIQHQSIVPAVLDRYSVKFSLLLVGVLVLFVASGVFVAMRWRRLPARCTWIATQYERRPGAFAALIATGTAFVGLAFFVNALISLFFPVLPLLVSMAVIYAGGVGIVLSVLTKTQTVSLGQQVALVLLSVCIGFGVGEIGLRLGTQATPYRVLKAGMNFSFHPDPDVIEDSPGSRTIPRVNWASEAIHMTPKGGTTS